MISYVMTYHYIIIVVIRIICQVWWNYFTNSSIHSNNLVTMAFDSWPKILTPSHFNSMVLSGVLACNIQFHTYLWCVQYGLKMIWWFGLTECPISCWHCFGWVFRSKFQRTAGPKVWAFRIAKHEEATILGCCAHGRDFSLGLHAADILHRTGLPKSFSKRALQPHGLSLICKTSVAAYCTRYRAQINTFTLYDAYTRHCIQIHCIQWIWGSNDLKSFGPFARHHA